MNNTLMITRPKKKLIRGTLKHRFASDDAISGFCRKNYLVKPRVSRTGEVTAWCSYTEQRVTLGWVL